MPTHLDTITLAFRRIGVVAEGEQANADQVAAGEAILAGLLAEIDREFAPGWAPNTVPAVAFVPLAHLLACDLAGSYAAAMPEARGRPWLRLAAAIRADNRPDWRDIDGNGTVDAGEADAGDRARFY